MAHHSQIRWYNPRLNSFEWREVPQSDEEALSLLEGSPYSATYTHRPTASGASWEPQSKRRSLGRARRPRNSVRTRSGRATSHARVKALGQPPADVAVVLPGGPLHLLGHEPPAAEARYHRAIGPPED